MRFALIVVTIGALALPAAAHEAETGQDYSKFRQRNGSSCCSDQDCRRVRYQVRPDGAVVMYPNDQPVIVPQNLLNERYSDDGYAHWCGLIVPGRGAYTYCAILPRQMTQLPCPERDCIVRLASSLAIEARRQLCGHGR
jgi:hypothetical protein